MTIKKYVFKMHKNNQITSEDTFELIRSKKNRNEIHVINRSTAMSGGKKELIYQTDKSDKEIIEHFNQTFEQYQRKIKETNSFFKQMKIVNKIDNEFDLFFGNPIREDIRFFKNEKDRTRDLSPKPRKEENARMIFTATLFSSILLTILLYISFWMGIGFKENDSVFEPLIFGSIYFFTLLIIRFLFIFRFKDKNNKTQNRENRP